jgi:hypothetical protein
MKKVDCDKIILQGIFRTPFDANSLLQDGIIRQEDIPIQIEGILQALGK